MIFRIAILAVVAAFVFAVSPSVAQDKPAAVEKKGTTVQSTATAYSCPMHAAVTSEKAGKCPQCGMELTKKTAATSMKSSKSTGKKSAMKGCCGEPCGEGCGDK